MENNVKVSVIIPTYNRAQLIKNSIISVLNQTYKNLEVIVVDDASTDNTKTIIQQINDHRLKYIKNDTNLGPSQSRNNGIKSSSGEVIAFQDSDDEWCESKLEKQIQLLYDHSNNFGAVYCGSEIIDAITGKILSTDLQNVDFKTDFVSGDHLPHTPSTVSSAIKKSVIEEVGAFDPRLKAMEDTELAMRISMKYDYGYINEPLIRIKRSQESLMSNIQNYTIAKEIVLEKHEDFLSPKILYSFCKDISNYYILKGQYSLAKKFVKKTFTYSTNIKTIFQYVLLSITPFIIKKLYKMKYDKGIPHPTFEGQYIKEV